MSKNANVLCVIRTICDIDSVTKHVAASRFLDMVPDTCVPDDEKREGVRRLRDVTLAPCLDVKNVIRYSGCWIDPLIWDKESHVGSYVNVFTSTARVIQQR